jgi:penicillin-binding protein 2
LSTSSSLGETALKREALRDRLTTRRALLAAGAGGGLFLLLAGRMYQLQIIDSGRYRLLAEKNRIGLRLIAPPRGRIIDRSGIPLADNGQNYHVVIVAEDAGDIRKTLAGLGKLVPLEAADRRRVLHDIARVRRFIPVVVRENLRWQEMARIEVATPELPGVSIEEGLTRRYPLGASASHVLGYVGAVSQAERDGSALLELPDFRIGKSGIEKAQDALLRGKAGTREVEVNAFGRVVRDLARFPPHPGKDIVTTLDAALQEFTFRRASEEPSVASVVLDAVTGGVLALASVPSFDPQIFSSVLSPASWRQLSTDPKHPLLNKAISGAYPPGSTLKPTVAVAALAAGAITPDTQFFCPGFLRLGEAVFHCWKKGGHGTLRLHDAIKESCDVYFYHVAMRLGIEALATMARRFGYGRPTGLGLPGERAGLIPTPEWQMAKRGIRWEPGETLITGIGQGAVEVTPLQIAVMVARLVTGRRVVPRLVRSVGEGGADKPPDFAALGIDPKILAFVVDAMVAVVNEPHGTGYALRIADPAFAMGGKSGTAQVHRITQFEREHDALTGTKVPWQDRDHALFVGFAPAGAPRFVCASVVEHGGTGGGEGAAAAGPIVRDVLLEVQKRALSSPNPPKVAARLSGPGRG